MRKETRFMSEKDTLLVMAAAYDDLADAEADYEAIKALYHEVETSHDFDAAVVAAMRTAKSRSSRSTSSPPATARRTGSAGGSRSGPRARSSPPSASSVDSSSAAEPARRSALSPAT
jgi:ABC-type Na+ efflux pump permease subunit